MFQHHIIAGTCHLLVTIVVGIVAKQREGITLIHLHMTESLERVAGLIEIGTVAIQTSSLMSEVNLTIKDGSIGILSLIVVQHIGMHQIYTGILSLGLTSGTTALLLLLCKSRHHAQGKDKKQ